MFLVILAHIIVFLGTAALVALTVTLVVLAMQKFLEIVKEWLAKKVGGTVIVTYVSDVAKEAVEEAKKKGNVKNLAQLEKLASSKGIIVAAADSNNQVNKDDIKIYQADSMDENIVKILDENDGLLAVTN